MCGNPGDPSVGRQGAGTRERVWEPEFCDCYYGFRPGRSAHDAVRRVVEVITNEGTQWVVEADIKGFFDHVSHTHLVRFLDHRIADPKLLRIVQRFLKACILEDGVFTASVEGTPQGELVSPVLSNIYLHYRGRSRRGRFVVGRKTDGKRKRRKLKQLSERLGSLRAEGGAAMVAFVRRHLRGHIHYYGVSGDSRGVAGYVYFATGLLFKWLNRRSQLRSLTWKRFGEVIRPRFLDTEQYQ